jgi:IS5 family transposase
MHIFRINSIKTFADRRDMIKPENSRQMAIEDFILPFGGKLDKRNRWVKLAETMPWEELSMVYNKSLSTSQGRPALPSRIVIGALIIKHMQNFTDEELMEQIRENAYLQYFLGYSMYDYDNIFEPSLLVLIRKRLGEESINEINEIFINRTKEKSRDKNKNSLLEKKDKNTSEKENKGILIADATVAPADIKYPTDIEILNEARKKSEEIIDKLYEPKKGKVKPRTYRKKARKSYLRLAKKRNKSRKEIRKGIKIQLQYIERNLKTIKRLSEIERFTLTYKELKQSMVIHEVYRQQKEMYDKKTHRIEDRIVSISQPHIRPIVRGKSKTPVEFGAKLSASVVENNIYLDHIGWNAFNEGLDLPDQVEKYKKRFGFYPEVAITDMKYGSRENRNYLKERGIRYSGTSLGRPKKDITPLENKIQKKQRMKEAKLRNEIEGKFGVGKRKFNLDMVYAKLKETSENWIAMVIFVMNIAHWLRDIFMSFFQTGLLFHIAYAFNTLLKNSIKYFPTVNNLSYFHPLKNTF